MIYHSFKVVQRDFGYAQKEIQRAKESAIEYLKEVVGDVGTVGIMLQGKPALLARHKEDAVIYPTIGKETAVNTENFGVEQLMDICKQVNGMKIVEEYEPA
ncbi:MAG: hypothetical protein IJQ06_00765 [Paludibacteraceae bacterium]|nr:hypothetical protein [Paludibacteraceae bacterium]